MKIKRTEDGFELSFPDASRDFHILCEPFSEDDSTSFKWVMDEFDSSVNDNNAAHIASDDFSTLEEAIHKAFDRCEAILSDKAMMQGQIKYLRKRNGALSSVVEAAKSLRKTCMANEQAQAFDSAIAALDAVEKSTKT